MLRVAWHVTSQPSHLFNLTQHQHTNHHFFSHKHTNQIFPLFGPLRKHLSGGSPHRAGSLYYKQRALKGLFANQPTFLTVRARVLLFSLHQTARDHTQQTHHIQHQSQKNVYKHIESFLFLLVSIRPFPLCYFSFTCARRLSGLPRVGMRWGVGNAAPSAFSALYATFIMYHCVLLFDAALLSQCLV